MSPGQQTQGGGLFGAKPATAAPATTSTGLFGSPKPANGGGLFGGATTTPATGGGLFGGGGGGGGLFGGATSTGTTGGLFGG